jgi:hypothetical protein
MEANTVVSSLLFISTKVRKKKFKTIKTKQNNTDIKKIISLSKVDYTICSFCPVNATFLIINPSIV